MDPLKKEQEKAQRLARKAELFSRALALVKDCKTSDQRARALSEKARLRILPSNHQVKVLLTTIRDRACSREDFVFYADRLTRMLVEEALNLLPFEEVKVRTPTGGEYSGVAMTKQCCGVSIVRSGEAMEEALRSVNRSVKIGKILIQRDEESARPRLLYINLPSDIKDRFVLLLDPMLATGGSAITAINILVEQQGVDPEKIIFVTLISAPEGIFAVSEAHPKVRMVTGEVDECLNAKSYIIPGIGDFGDRYFGTTDD